MTVSSTLDRITEILNEVSKGLDFDRSLALTASHVAAELGVPTCKIWVVKKGDMCDRCQLATVCINKEMCLHLVAAAGASIDKEYPRIPLSLLKAPLISQGGAGRFTDPSGPGEKLFGLQHGANDGNPDTFALHPIRGASGILGVIGVFNHGPIDTAVLRILSKFTAPTVTIIRVAELQAKCDSVRSTLDRQSAAAGSVKKSSQERERETDKLIESLSAQVTRLQAERAMLVSERDNAVEVAESLQAAQNDNSAKRDIERDAKKMAALQEENEKFTEQIVGLLAGSATMSEAIAAATENKAILEEEFADRTRLIDLLKSELDASEADVAAQHLSAARLQDTITQLEARIADLVESSAIATQIQATLTESLHAAEVARERLEQTRSALAAKVVDQASDVQRLRKQRERIESANGQLIEEVTRLRAEVSTLLQEKAVFDQERLHLRGTAVEATERLASAELQNKEMIGLNARLDSLLKGAESDLVSNRQQLAEARRRADGSDETRQKLEEQNRALSIRSAALEHEAEIRSRSLADMAHELRTPMNAIIGFTALILEDADPPIAVRYRKNLERIARNARELLQMINNLLDISRIGAGQAELTLEPVDIRQLTKQVIEIMEPLIAKGQPVELKVEIEDGLGQITTDKNRLQQVLINLVSNGLKFTSQGSVTIGATRVPGESGNDSVAISVADTGIGIHESDLTRIFDEFVQLNPRPNGSGFGLGLSITRQLVQMLGGSIKVESERGTGSVFSVELPANAPQGSVETEVSAPQGKAAMVCDGDPASLYLAKRYLMEAGYTVTTTGGPGSASEIPEIMNRTKPSIIAIDAGVPELFKTVLGLMPANGARRETTLIALCGDTEIQNRALALGADYSIGKPIDREEMMRIVDLAAHPHLRKILVVDDDPDTLELIVQMLDCDKFLIRTATTGKEALEEIARLRPEAVVLDLMLPELDGIEVLHRMPLIHESVKIPVVLITARDLSRDERQALEAETVSILQKGSFSRDLLISEVSRALGPKLRGAGSGLVPVDIADIPAAATAQPVA